MFKDTIIDAQKQGLKTLEEAYNTVKKEYETDVNEYVYLTACCKTESGDRITGKSPLTEVIKITNDPNYEKKYLKWAKLKQHTLKLMFSRLDISGTMTILYNPYKQR